MVVAVALYFIRMFAITGFYHRYFSHRTFKTSRIAQFLFAVWGNSSAQRGPIWWASQHRHHHTHSDDECDAHSPRQHGFYWSHIGWLTASDNLVIHARRVRDLLRFPELRFLDQFSVLVPFLLGAALFGLGALLEHAAPTLETNGWQLVVWGFFVSTVALQKRTGGNLAGLLDNLAYLIRERFKLRGRIRAISAHGRISGLVLSMIPVSVAILMFYTNPDYVLFFFDDPDGKVMLAVMIILQFLGFVSIRKLTDIGV